MLVASDHVYEPLRPTRMVKNE